MLKLLDMARGLGDHPSHPPMTDAAIGSLTLGSLMAVFNALDWFGKDTAIVAYYAIVFGVIAAVVAVVTGFLDYFALEAGSRVRRTATLHMIAMLAAAAVYLFTLGQMQGDYADGTLPSLAVTTSVIAFLLMTLGGWIGGALVFTYGNRVAGDTNASVFRALSPFHGRRDKHDAVPAQGDGTSTSDPHAEAS